ncbi:MAG: DUF5995 family protein [Actinomycetota bacterium]|nr:DUF5995 family protein [Actinomycetota bacterium]
MVRDKARIAIAAALLALVAGTASSGARAEVINIPWTELLPPQATLQNPQPGPVAHCRKPSLRCVRVEIRRLREYRNALGCDHRAVFATTYLVLTKQLLQDVKTGALDFISPRYFYFEDALFANFYFRVSRAWNRGDDVPEAWRVAFMAAASPDKAGVQDMLLGINAHVQNDMPFVLAALGLRTRDGRSRKPDHDAVNATLNRAYPRVVAAVRRRFDPSLDLSNSPLIPLDDLAGLELTRTWREVVWRNAERLLNAETQAQWTRVAQSIEDYAALNARLIAAGGLPGYGATRDAYCAAGPSGS